MYIILLNQNSNKWFTWLVYSIGEDIICLPKSSSNLSPLSIPLKKKKRKTNKVKLQSVW